MLASRVAEVHVLEEDVTTRGRQVEVLATRVVGVDVRARILEVQEVAGGSDEARCVGLGIAKVSRSPMEGADLEV